MADHCGLRYMFYQPKINVIQARWMALLSEFDFEIKHIKGKENSLVHALRRSVKGIHLVAISTCETNVRERVKSAQETDAFFQSIKSYLEQESTGMKCEGYQWLNDVLVTYKGRLYIPKFDGLNRFMMDELHKRPYTSHLGYPKMITSTRKLFYWLGLKKDIADYLTKCLECQ
jgi:hypothetical protein